MSRFPDYQVPIVGDFMETEHGLAKVTRLITYDEVVEEMRFFGASKKELKRFNSAIRVFLQDETMYFECEIVYPNGECERIDWSDYNSRTRGDEKKRGAF